MRYTILLIVLLSCNAGFSQIDDQTAGVESAGPLIMNRSTVDYTEYLRNIEEMLAFDESNVENSEYQFYDKEFKPAVVFMNDKKVDEIDARFNMLLERIEYMQDDKLFTLNMKGTTVKLNDQNLMYLPVERFGIVHSIFKEGDVFIYKDYTVEVSDNKKEFGGFSTSQNPSLKKADDSFWLIKKGEIKELKSTRRLKKDFKGNKELAQFIDNENPDLENEADLVKIGELLIH